MARISAVTASGLTLLLAGGLAEAADSFATDGSLEIVWHRQYTSELDDWINQIKALSDGNYLAVGFVGRSDAGPSPSDWRALAVKFDGTGKEIWKREHGAGGGVDAYWAAHETAEGKIAAGGFTTRIGSGGIDASIAVLDAQGWILKENAFGGIGYDRFTDITGAADGGFVLAGFTEGLEAGAHRDVLLLQTTANGVEDWRNTFGGPGNDVALYLERTSDGGYVLSGGVSATSGADSDSDLLVMKVDADGRQQWRTVIGASGSDDTNHGLALRENGEILVVGYTKSWGARDNDLMAVTLSAEGAVLRREIFGGPDDDRAMTVSVDTHGHAWLTGYTKSAGAGGWDAFLTRLDREGAFEECLSTIGGPADDQGTALLPLDEGDLLLGGYSSNLGGGQQDAFVLRLKTPECTRRDPAFLRRVVEGG
jgi:hypothetical protein